MTMGMLKYGRLCSGSKLKMFFEIYIWVLAFLSTFLTLFWIIVSRTYKGYSNVSISDLPVVTICVPVWKEEKEAITGTLKSIIAQDYPKDKIEIIVVDDKGNFETPKFIKNLLKEKWLAGWNIRLLEHKQNLGKAGAVNSALKIACGEFFWVFDADSYPGRDLLKNMVERFYEPNSEDVAAVVAITLIKNQVNYIAKMQRLEYVMAAFIRKLMGAVNTLHTTNALSLFRTRVLQKAGGFDVGNLTEDFEIAMRLRSNGYRVVMCEHGRFYTNVPTTLKSMWKQRVRWFRGFIYNNLKYKKMIFNSRLGFLGLFQIPLEILILLTVFVSVAMFGYNFIKMLIDAWYKVYLMQGAIFDFTIPTLQQFILSINWKLMFPSLIVLVLGLYMYFQAHKYAGEKWRFYIPSLLYLFVYPLFRSMQWVEALVLEGIGARRNW